MGDTLSKNIVDDSIDLMSESVSDSTQSCIYTINESESQTIQQPGNNNTVNINQDNFQEYASVDTQCFTNSQTMTMINSQVSTTTSQIASAIGQSLDLNPGSTKAENTLKLLTQMQDIVINAYTQTCATNFNGTQTVAIDQSGNNNTVNIGVVNYSEAFSDTQSCVQENVSSTSTYTTLVQQLSQSAKAETEGLLAGLLTIVIIIIIVLGVIFFGGVKAVTNWKFLLTIFIILLVYFVLAAINKWWPFHNDGNSPSS